MQGKKMKTRCTFFTPPKIILPSFFGTTTISAAHLVYVTFSRMPFSLEFCKAKSVPFPLGMHLLKLA